MNSEEKKNNNNLLQTYSFNWNEKIKYITELVIVRLFGAHSEKNRNIWIFGAKNGEKFDDNPMYFYKYVLEHKKEIKAVWIANNESVIKEVQNVGGEAYKVMSLKSLKYILKAKVYIYSHNLDTDIRIYDDRRTVFVNLWHGMPIKKIIYDDQTYKEGTSIFSMVHKLIRVNLLRFKKSEDLGDIICSTSEYTKEFMASAFRSKNVKVTGQLRGDIIYNLIANNSFMMNLKKNKHQKLILYMPTHRDWGKMPTKNIFDNEEFTKKLIEFCKINNYIFAIKYHPNEKVSKKNFINDYIVDISDVNVDIQELLVEADILITDYSSCFIDFTLLRKPIIFYAYDLDKYCNRDMGLYINYKNDLPGPIAYNEKELLKTIIDYTTDTSNSIYIKEYGEKLLKYHKYFDDKSGERIYNEILELL